MKVRNKNVFTAIACQCTSFLCHWENYAKTKVKVCSALGCSETKNLLGAHVINCHGLASSVQYIVPLCPSCNSSKNKDCFDLKASAVLVPVATRTRCEPC